MGEHLLCKQKVVGSIPIASTNKLLDHCLPEGGGIPMDGRPASVSRMLNFGSRRLTPPWGPRARFLEIVNRFLNSGGFAGAAFFRGADSARLLESNPLLLIVRRLPGVLGALAVFFRE